ncbi:MAG: exosortase/archaeosortase family protein [Pirellulaceae bacterium]
MMQQETSKRNSAILATLVIVLVMAVVYWPSMRMLTRVWETPDYSHGYLVPLFAGFLLWVRRDMLKFENMRGSWFGVLLILASALFFVGAGVLGFKLIGAFSLLPALAGIVLMIGGWSMFRWAWPAIVFLGFMIPLPVAMETMATQPLRRVGTLASTYILQTVGLPAISEGNVILLSDYEIGVAEACSGLRMLMTSGALAFGLAFIVQRPLWERFLIVLSAVPIALITNIFRIAITGLCYEFAGQELADHVFHNVAGWLMMPMAVGLLWLELAILSRLTIEPQQGPAMVGALAKM